VRAAVSFVVVMLLAGATLEAQDHAPAKAAPAKPTVAPPKPVVHEAPKPPAAPAAKPAAPAATKPPARTLEEAAEAIAAALAARGVKPAARPLALRGTPAPRAPRIPRYSLYWPDDDIDWQVQWPIVSGRVALSWDDADPAQEPASD
jgi:hypothetical protein